ncbi:MAG: phosphatidylserine decarboxylase [Epsilonproteobacteria bacterium]|nr:phosphatidylserine decarboxylase [Campylobacterota bacterium]
MSFISKYGLEYVLYSFVAFVVLYIFDFDFLATVAFFVLAALVFFFRNPERELNNFDDTSVLAPCDGVVQAIDEIKSEDGYTYEIKIESSFLDVSVLRMPITAKVESLHVIRGTRVASTSSLYKKLNESLEIVLDDEKGNKLKMLHRLQKGAFTIFCDQVEGERLHKSIRYGYANNCITTLYLKSNVRINIKVGQRVYASQTLIAYFS